MSLRSRINQRLTNYDRLAIWGAGGLGQTAIRYWLPSRKVRVVVDSRATPGRCLDGWEVYPPQALDCSSIDAVVICTSAQLSARRDLLALGYTGPAFYIYELFLPSSGMPLTPLESLAVDIAVSKNNSWPLFLLLKPQILVNMTFRVTNWASEHWWRRPVYWMLYILHHFVCLLLSIQLPIKTSIGPGLIFAHYGTIVFTQRARIGSFFTIYHGCTVGTNDSGEGPIIGDYVSQYAGSHVLGHCKIGDKSRIGANAVVLNIECPPEATLVGVPAQIVTPKHREQ